MTLKSLNLKLLNKRTLLTKNKYFRASGTPLQWGVNSVFGIHCIFWDSFYISHPSTKLHLRAFGMQTAIRLLRFLLQLGLCRGSIKATRPTLSQCTHCGETTKVVHCSSSSEASRFLASISGAKIQIIQKGGGRHFCVIFRHCALLAKVMHFLL